MVRYGDSAGKLKEIWVPDARNSSRASRWQLLRYHRLLKQARSQLS